MASYRKRPNGNWLAEVRKQGVSPVRKTFALKSEAKAWAQKEESRITSGGSVTKETLGWLIEHFQEHRTTNTYEDSVLKWWRKRLGNKKLSELRRKDFTLARAALVSAPKERGEGLLAPATVNRRVAAVSAVLSYGIDELEVLDVNPARLKSLPENNKRDRLLSDEERERLMDACRNFTTGSGKKDAQPEPALYLLVRLAMITGARAGELTGLCWCDVNLENGYAILRDTKNGDTRSVPIAGEAFTLLTEWKRTRRRFKTDVVIYNTRTMVAPYNYRQHWMAAKKTAGIENFRFHDLRHGAASELAMAGVSLGQIGELLGHRSAQMTKRYSHYSTGTITALGDVLAGRTG